MVHCKMFTFAKPFFRASFANSLQNHSPPRPWQMRYNWQSTVFVPFAITYSNGELLAISRLWVKKFGRQCHALLNNCGKRPVTSAQTVYCYLIGIFLGVYAKTRTRDWNARSYISAPTHWEHLNNRLSSELVNRLKFTWLTSSRCWRHLHICGRSCLQCFWA